MGHLYASICNNLDSASNHVPNSAYFFVQLPGFNVVLSMGRYGASFSESFLFDVQSNIGGFLFLCLDC